MPTLPTLPYDAINHKTILIRADLNVPMTDGVITDIVRIERFIPTVQELLPYTCKIVIMTHMGRPKNGYDAALSTQILRPILQEHLNRDVVFYPDITNQDYRTLIDDAPDNAIILLENLRFYEGETKNDDGLARILASLADIYINDAFSCAHRAHSSTHAITKYLPSYAGLSLHKEVAALTQALETPKKPVSAIVGGSKISTKIEVLSHLTTKVDSLIIGGGMANSFLRYNGVNIGASLCETNCDDIIRTIYDNASKHNCAIILPIDVVIAATIHDGANAKTCDVDTVPDDAMILDAGPKTIQHITTILQQSKTLLWNGPLGAFEFAPFDVATTSIAHCVSTCTHHNNLISVAGGGDTVAALNKAGCGDALYYVSTAGGAFLEWVEGKNLPGIDALLS